MMSGSNAGMEPRSGAGERLVPVRIETSFIEEEAQPASLLRLLNVLLRHRRTLVAIPVLVAVVVCGVTLVLPRSYTAHASFLPSETPAAQLGQIAGLAAQFGFSLPGASPAESPEFYAALLNSEQVLQSVVISPFRRIAGTDRDTTWIDGDLIELWDIGGRRPARRIEKASMALRKRLSVRTSAETGMVMLRVRTRWPELSVQIVDRLLLSVNEFNLQTRRSRAMNEREFIAGRLVEAREELKVVEDSLKRFLEENRRVENSPELRFERDRLQARVSLHQEVNTSLAQALEQAKIEEVRNTPVITVVEEPYHPARADRRHLITRGLLSLALGAVLALVVAFVREFLVLSRQADPERYEEFRQLSGDARRDLRSLWQTLRGRQTSGSGTP